MTGMNVTLRRDQVTVVVVEKISIIYGECVFNHYAMSMGHIILYVIYGLSGCTKIFPNISQKARISEKYF